MKVAGVLCQILTIGDKGNRGKITIADGKGGGDFWKTPIVQPLRMRDLVPFRCEPLFVFEANYPSRVLVGL